MAKGAAQDGNVYFTGSLTALFTWSRQIYPGTAFIVFNLFLLSKSLYIIIGRGSRGSDIFSCHTG